MCKYRYIKVQFLSGIVKILSTSTDSLSLIPARCFFPPASVVGESPSPSDRQLYTHLSVDGLGVWGGGGAVVYVLSWIMN
jgi:hypothetical protein